MSNAVGRNAVKNFLRPFVPLADRILSNKKIKDLSLKAATKFLRRYAKYGENVSTTTPREYLGNWKFMLDTPKVAKSANRQVYVSGWFVPLGLKKKVVLRLAHPSGKVSKIKYGLDRNDVAAILRGRDRQTISSYCGFGSVITIDTDGEYILEVKLQNKWHKVCRFDMEYDLDLQVKDVTNPSLVHNMAEHLTLIDTKKRYFFEPEIDQNYQIDEAFDPKLVAFYLPQFHPFKENDEWWGKGFTEWSNVAAAVPRFVGHEQPKLPTDLGYYDLRYEENILKQITMAKKHGVYGFCFYYYWFSGKRLMERPLDSVLKHKEWDFNFMICWANENWTRRWDGRSEDVLIEQKHNLDDPLNFIKDVEHILTDKRYIKVDGNPALMVYRAHDLDDIKQYVKIWRDYFKNKYNLGLHLIAVQAFSNEDPKEFGFDKGLEFVPLSLAASLKKPLPSYDFSNKTIDIKYTGIAYDYRKIVLDILSGVSTKRDVYRSIMPSWDNDARRKGSGGVFHNSNPDIYGQWLDGLINKSARASGSLPNDLLFINAWNEWAEGTYLEPDSMYGHAFLNRTAQTLAMHSSNTQNKLAFPPFDIVRNSNTKTAVVVHLFYADMWQLFETRLQDLRTVEYDLFITMPAKNGYICETIKKFKPDARIVITPNRGRDVLPFVHIARRLKLVGYEYVLKLHSKKSIHRNDGNLWMQDMLAKLIPNNSKDIEGLYRVLENENTGVVGPESHYVSLESYFGSNKEMITLLLDEIVGQKATNKVIKDVGAYGFFAGTMFWARLDAIEPILNQLYQASDFESESGQIDGTFAHALERLFCLVPHINGKKTFALDGAKPQEVIISAAENFQDYSFAKNKQ